MSECENNELDSSSNSTFNHATYREDILKLLNKASCYELLSKASMLRSEIMMRYQSFNTSSSHYEDNILEFDKSLEDFLISVERSKLISSSLK